VNQPRLQWDISLMPMEPTKQPAWRLSVISRRSLFWLFLALTPFVLVACSSTSSTLGQIHEGRILSLTVLEMDRSEELRYSTPYSLDPSDATHQWRIQPSKSGLELLLVRMRVENHIAVNAVFVADQRAVILRDFFENDYFPLSVGNTVYLDRRGRSEASVTMEGGQCTDHARLVVNAGTNVEWTNSGDTASAIQFGPGELPALGNDPVQIAPGGSVSHLFDQPGTFDYLCAGGEDSGGEEAPQGAQILVENADSVRSGRDNNILFLENTFELSRGTGVDGWMVFEVPVDTQIRDLRWRAGDSITIRF